GECGAEAPARRAARAARYVAGRIAVAEAGARSVSRSRFARNVNRSPAPAARVQREEHLQLPLRAAALVGQPEVAPRRHLAELVAVARGVPPRTRVVNDDRALPVVPALAEADRPGDRLVAEDLVDHVRVVEEDLPLPHVARQARPRDR